MACICHPEEWFLEVQKVALSFLEHPVLIGEPLPSEHKIMAYSMNALLGYETTYSQEVCETLDKYYEKGLGISFVIANKCSRKDTRGIDIYFEMLDVSKGKNTFVFKNVQTTIGFDFGAEYHLRRNFSDYDFSSHIATLKSEKAREKAIQYFTK